MVFKSSDLDNKYFFYFKHLSFSSLLWQADVKIVRLRSSRPEVKKVFLEISQNPQENTCASVGLQPN